jgi:hypothetical protein
MVPMSDIDPATATGRPAFSRALDAISTAS